MLKDIPASKQIRLAAMIAMAIALFSCHGQGDPASTGNNLRRGLSGEPSTLDPAAAADNYSQEVIRDLYEGLTSESRTGEVMPGVASSWQVDANGTTYAFHLRSNARWSNGSPVRAQDFVSAWQRVVDPKQASPVADDLRIIAGAVDIISGKLPASKLGISAPNDNTLIVRLAQQAPYLPQLLTHTAALPIYSQASASSHNPKIWVSNGPYVLSAWSTGSSIRLSKNASYWDSANVKLQTVEYQFVPDDHAQLSRYRAGQLDITDTVPANSIPSLRREHSSELAIYPFLATAYYGLNLSNRPLGANLKLRQALAMAIDRRKLVQSLGFEQQPAYGFVPPGTWNYSPQSWQWDNLSDVDRLVEAKRLYAEAGYIAATPLRLRLLFNSNPVIRNTAIVIASMWKENLGVETDLNEEEYRVFLQLRYDKSRWDVARLGWTADYNDAGNFLDIFRQGSANNDSGYANPSFDALVERASRTSDPLIRRQFLEDSERIVLSDYPVIPLYFFVSKRLVKPYVAGFHANPLNRIYSKALAIVSR